MMTGCQARLNTESGGGAWCPSRVIDLNHSLQEWLEVDLRQETLVTAVVVQGRYANGLGQEYAEHFALRYQAGPLNKLSVEMLKKWMLINISKNKTFKHTFIKDTGATKQRNGRGTAAGAKARRMASSEATTTPTSPWSTGCGRPSSPPECGEITDKCDMVRAAARPGRTYPSHRSLLLHFIFLTSDSKCILRGEIILLSANCILKSNISYD